MAISETSKAASRTIGLKPLLVGEYSAKSSVTRSDLIEPSFSADVQAWSPSNVRSRIATSVLHRLVEIDEAGLGQRLAHIVHIEPEHAGRELLALALLIGLALFALGRATSQASFFPTTTTPSSSAITASPGSTLIPAH